MNHLRAAQPTLAALLAAALLFPTPVAAGGKKVKRAHPGAGGHGAAVVVGATVETEPVPHRGDAADDAAIWVHPADPSLSTIIGSDKQGGLAVYDLSGQQLQYVAGGSLNNVDVRYDFPLGGRAVALVAASSKSDGGVAVYRVDPATRRLELTGSPIRTGPGVYGLCLYRSRLNAKYYAFVTYEKGGAEQWELFANAGRVEGRKVRTLPGGGQAEGCVADDELGHLYLAEEEVGIWKYGAEPDAGETHTKVDSTDGGGHLTADVEGLAIYAAGDGTGYLIASSQGNNSFVVYRREANNPVVLSFTIGARDGIDAVEDTDGIDVTSASLGPAFPQGLFVAQDGGNDRGNQNFKLVPWEAIANALRPQAATARPDQRSPAPRGRR